MRQAPAWDRFGHWPPLPARILLLGVAVLLVLAALPSVLAAGGSAGEIAAGPPDAAAASGPGRDKDLELYQRITERVVAGDSYYKAAVEEQRARGFPVRPGLAVRLPTLAVASALLGPWGVYAAAALLTLVTLIAWWRRLGEEPGGADRRVVAMLLLVIGASIAFKPQYFAQHEVWAGVLLALSFALHRNGRWVGSLLVAALALAIREHALPFLLLMGAMAAWERQWKECLGWCAIVLLFAVGLLVHLSIVAHYVNPQDLPGPPWLAFRGLEGFTSDVVPSSSLYLLPGFLAAPIALLPLIGWAGWRTPMGAFGTLLYAGYAVFLMIAGRENNFYWALVITPAYFVGLVFLPMALRSLWRAARSSR